MWLILINLSAMKKLLRRYTHGFRALVLDFCVLPKKA